MARLAEPKGKSQHKRIDEALAAYQKRADQFVKNVWGPKFHASVAWWWDSLGTANMAIRVVRGNAVYAEQTLPFNGISDTLPKGDEERIAYEKAEPKEASEIEVDYWDREIRNFAETFDYSYVMDLYRGISSPNSKAKERIDPRPSESLVPPKFGQFNDYRQGPYYWDR